MICLIDGVVAHAPLIAVFSHSPYYVCVFHIIFTIARNHLGFPSLERQLPYWRAYGTYELWPNGTISVRPQSSCLPRGKLQRIDRPPYLAAAIFQSELPEFPLPCYRTSGARTSRYPRHASRLSSAQPAPWTKMCSYAYPSSHTGCIDARYASYHLNTSRCPRPANPP